MEEYSLRFQINNIGAIENADVEIDGITIIAGENNVGKSTIGKALYAFLHDMYSWENIYNETCSSRLEKFLYQNSSLLDDWCMKVSGAKRRRTNKVNQLIKQYANNEEFRVSIEDYQLADDEQSQNEAHNNLRYQLGEYCYAYLFLYAKDKAEDIWGAEEFGWVYDWIINTMSLVKKIELDEITIQISKIKQSLNEVFKGQYRKIGTEKSKISFCDDIGRTVNCSIDDKNMLIDAPVRMINRVFFIESPKLYDYLSDTAYGHVQKDYLRFLMAPNVFNRNRFSFMRTMKVSSVVEEISNESLKDITNRLVKTMGGRADFLQKIGLEFKDDEISEPIHAVNVSTGLKSLALLEYALRIGAIEDGDILILDEPEINLHPDWQVEYARTLVELQKYFNLKIIITSHSPYFMRAIECFTDVNDTMDRLNVYRVSEDKKNKRHLIENVSYSEYGMTDLYDDLSAPLEELEKLLEEKYGGENISTDDESIG